MTQAEFNQPIRPDAAIVLLLLGRRNQGTGGSENTAVTVGQRRPPARTAESSSAT